MEQREALRTAVRRVAWAHVLLLVDVNLGTLNILPSWLGYVLILRALPALNKEAPSAHLLDPLGVLLAFWSGVLWLAQLFGTTLDWPLPQLLAAVLSLYFLFQLWTNLADIAAAHGCACAGILRVLRTAETLLTTAGYLLGAFVNTAVIRAVLAAISLAAVLWICKTLFLFHRQLGEAPPAPNSAP